MKSTNTVTYFLFRSIWNILNACEKDCVGEVVYCKLQYEHEIMKLICKYEELNKQVMISVDPSSRGDLTNAVSFYI